MGRTDLLGEEHREELSGLLYDSLFDKIIPLGMGVIVYPGHGAGSVCGGNISEREETTIGIELEYNPMLSLDPGGVHRQEDEGEDRTTAVFPEDGGDQPERPPVAWPSAGAQAFAGPGFPDAMKGNMTVLDVRMPHSFGGAHIAGSLSIWLDGLSQYGGYYLDYDQADTVGGGEPVAGAGDSALPD